MVSRWRRHLDLLQAIDMEPDFDGKHPDEMYSAAMRDRPMHKDEIVQVCEILDVETAGTVPELRGRLRSQFKGLYEDKQGSSQFSTSELFYLNRHCNRALRLDADEVNIYEDLPNWSGELHVMTEDGKHDLEVTEKAICPWRDFYDAKPRYNLVEIYTVKCEEFDRKHRLVVIRGKTDSCKYNGSVVLEQPHDYGPYKRWKKKSYVRDLTPEVTDNAER